MDLNMRWKSVGQWSTPKPWKLMNYDKGIADTFHRSLGEASGDLRPYTEPGPWRDHYDQLVSEGKSFHQAFLISIRAEVDRLHAESQS